MEEKFKTIEKICSRQQNLDQKRLGKELILIKELDLTDDFYELYKTQKQGNENNVNSLVAYAIGITSKLPDSDFNPNKDISSARMSPPDIDLDFADIRRDEVIEYVANKYGHNKVAQIITFGTMAARAVIRDVGRVLDYNYGLCDKMAKMIPFGFNLDQAIKQIPEFREAYESDEKIKRLIDLAKKLEGVARHASTHACGIVISSEPLDNLVPLQRTTQDNDAVVTQYEMYSIEDLGLLKMDFLGLKNLTTIERTIDLVKLLRKKQIDIDNTPEDDRKTYRLLQKAETTSVFQMESNGMKRWLKQLQASKFEDIVAMLALYRPGPMQFIPEYVARKKNKRRIEYIHPKLKPILESTYGICVSGDSFIQTTDSGAVYKIKEIVNSSKKIGIQSFNGTKFLKKNIINKFNNGIKSTYQISLRTGKQIKATRDHEFLTPEGWKKVKELKKGDFLATPKRLFAGNKQFDKGKLKILAYLIADGALTQGVSCYFVNKDTVLLKDFKKTAEKSFQNIKIKFTKHIRGVQRAVPTKILTKKKNYHEPNEILKWLRELDLKSKTGGKKSDQKFIPPFVFKLDEECIATFLATYWDSDGGINQKYAYLKTTSKNIAQSIQTLLLKLGINSHLYKTGAYWGRKGKKMETYQVTVYHLENFYGKVARLMVSNKKLTLKKYLGNHKSKCKEFVPRKIFVSRLIKYLRARQISFRKFSDMTKISRSLFYDKKSRNSNRLNLKVGQKIANFTKDQKLQKICSQKNVRWEDILSITPAGREHVYDLEIQGTHNFVANNIISHNCIYQEQLMQITQEIAGFSLSEADVLRKAVGKKIHSLLTEQKERFIQGAIKQSVDKYIAEKIWSWFLPFASYAFNRSHSVGYATIAYQTAYLKANFPVEYMASVLATEKQDVERMAFLIDECKRMGIKVLPPDINESHANFTVVGKNQIRFGLWAIKNVGHNIVTTVIGERKANGKFQSIEDFIDRIHSRDLNKKSMDALIKTGAFDKLEERNILLNNLETLLSYSREIKGHKKNGQKGLFDNSSIKTNISLLPSDPASQSEKLKWEKNLLGVYVSGHPLEAYKKTISKKVVSILKIKQDLLEQDDKIKIPIAGALIKKIAPGNRVSVCGLITKIKKILTKTGRPMYFINVEDLTGSIETILFPNTAEAISSILEEGKIVIVTGRVDLKDQSPKLIAQSIEEIVEE
ncbi:hypothetical protein KJ591_01115 [Patescibacteria group bacterium]|nr:hypothetical protein [Patescibacteria group bacterium]